EPDRLRVHGDEGAVRLLAGEGDEFGGPGGKAEAKAEGENGGEAGGVGHAKESPGTTVPGLGGKVFTHPSRVLVPVHPVQGPEVVLDHRLELRRQVADDLLHDLLPRLLGELAPVLLVAAELLLVDRPLAAVGGDVAVRHRAARVASAVAGLAAAGALAAVALLVPLLGLGIQFLDLFVEPEDDLLL